MRNIEPVAPGICRVCRGFVDPQYPTCFKCGFQPEALDVVVPITYSEHLGQIHLALRNYKDGGSRAIRRHDSARIAAILWRFLREHEDCVANAAGAEHFDVVTLVPSSNPDREAESPFAALASWIEPIAPRLRRVLAPTGEVQGRGFAPNRFTATTDLSGSSVLLLDDTWATGGHAQSAAHALLTGGAEKVALVVVGRHVRPDYEPVKGSGETCGDLLKALPEDFDWRTCAVHPERQPTD